jgi:hypothetical protein
MHITYWTNPVCLVIKVDAGSITPTNKFPGTIFLCVIVQFCYDCIIVMISSSGVISPYGTTTQFVLCVRAIGFYIVKIYCLNIWGWHSRKTLYFYFEDAHLESCPGQWVSWFSPVPQGKCWDITSKTYLLSSISFPIILLFWLYIVWDTDSFVK